MKSKNFFWVLLAICVLTVIPFLGLCDYNTKGEPRESIVSYTMIESGNWTLPRNSVGEMAYKPPLFHWCVAAVSVVLGELNEFTSRIPSAVAYILLTLSVFLFFQHRRGSRVAFVTALVTFTSWELHRQGGNCRVDMLLTLFTVLAMMSLYQWWENKMEGIPLMAILMMSLGTLTKGPVGALIPCLVVGVFLLVKKVNFWRAFLSLFLFGLLSLVLPAIWYYAAWKQGGQEFLDLMMEENVGRMTQTMSYDSCVNPWYYHFMTLSVGYLPWTLFAVMTLFVLDWKGIRSRWSGVGDLWRGISLRKMHSLDLFSLLAVAVIFVFYCFSQSKRSVYIMPLYPFLGYFIARLLFWVEEHHRRVLTAYGGFLSVVGLVVAAAFVVLKFVPANLNWFHGRHAFENFSMLYNLQHADGWWQWGLWLLGVALLAWWWISQRNILGVLLMIVAIYIHVDGVYKPPVLNAKSVKSVAAVVDEMAPESAGRLYEFVEAGVLAAGDPVHYFEMNFYLHDRVGDFYRQRPHSGFLMVGADDWKKWQQKFEGEGYRFSQVYESGDKRVMKQQLLLLRFEK